jgi:hypothetical protein
VIYIIAPLVIAWIIFLISVSFFSSLTTSYAIQNNKLYLMYFKKIPIGWVSLNNIKEIKRYYFGMPGDEKVYFPLRWENKLLGDQVLIVKKHGLFKNILLTPDNSDQFIEDIKRQIAD